LGLGVNYPSKIVVRTATAGDETAEHETGEIKNFSYLLFDKNFL